MIEPGMLLGVASAAAWGAGDFAGGVAARRASGMLVTAGAEVIGFLLLLGAAAVLRPAAPEATTILLSCLAGVTGGLGLAALYRALSMGAMGLVSAVSGVGGVLIPLGIGVLLLGTTVQPLQLLGVACALAAIAAASGATTRGVSRDAVVLAAVAAIGFGLWFVLIDQAAERDKLWALVISRGTATVLIGAIALVRAERQGLRGVLPLVGFAGLADVAANGMAVLAFVTVPVGIVAALSGTYPLATMLLARVILHEALPRLGLLAVVLGVAGIVLISLGA